MHGGPVSNTVVGCRLAWIHRWRLLGVLLPIAATALTGLVALDLLAGPDQMVIVDGRPRVDGSVMPWVRLGVVAAAWLLAVCVATSIVVEGGRRRAAFRAGLRRLPVAATGLAAAGGATMLALWVVTGIAAPAGAPIWLGLVLLTLVAGAVAMARVLIRVLTGADRGAGVFLLGGVIVPLTVAALIDDLPVIPTVLAIAVVAVQAGILAHLGSAATTTPPPTLDRRPWLSLAALVVAVVLPFVVAVINPLHAATVETHGDAPAGVSAITWPAGGHPVVATVGGVRFCDDDGCARYVAHNSAPAVMDGHGSAGISADGRTVVKATLTGGKDTGGPFVHFARCTRDGCRQSRVATRASAEEAFDWPDMAAAVANDGTLWFVLATPSATTYRITFLRCADVECPRPERISAGTVERIPGDDGGQRARLSIGDDGSLAATIRTGSEAVTVRCAPAGCAAPGGSWAFAGRPDAVWVAPPLVTLEPGSLRLGDRLINLASGPIPDGSGALATRDSVVYATAAESTAGPAEESGLHLRVAAPAAHRQILWRCAEGRCERHALDGFDDTAGREAIAVAEDGRVLIVRPDRVLLVTL